MAIYIKTQNSSLKTKIMNKIAEVRKIKEDLINNGIESFNSNGLIFKWCDWVLCSVSNRTGNPVHNVIMTNFSMNEKKKHFSATRWNPTYEDDYHRASLDINSLHVWQPVMVIPDFKFFDNFNEL